MAALVKAPSSRPAHAQAPFGEFRGVHSPAASRSPGPGRLPSGSALLEPPPGGQDDALDELLLGPQVRPADGPQPGDERRLLLLLEPRAELGPGPPPHLRPEGVVAGVALPRRRPGAAHAEAPEARVRRQRLWRRGQEGHSERRPGRLARIVGGGHLHGRRGLLPKSGHLLELLLGKDVRRELLDVDEPMQLLAVVGLQDRDGQRAAVGRVDRGHDVPAHGGRLPLLRGQPLELEPAAARRRAERGRPQAAGGTGRLLPGEAPLAELLGLADELNCMGDGV
mmetsp:Transcript_89998/g.254914  ORF Transcript_89998/g.254914 Transcript_89998/m.254914 type:complete len:281 (+) Transcript_89998:59-901(+)